MYKKVLLAYDGSIEGRRALREGAKLAQLCRAEVFLLAVVELDAAANADYVVAFKRLRNGVEVVPHLRGNRAGAVAQAEFQPGFAAARRSSDFFFADEEERSDHLAVRKIADARRLHQPLAFGSGSFRFCFFLSVASGVGATF